ncbi:MAG: hypothetical protein GY847_19210 [Proteobacteria bacterium]|nr:hypothetical protein [Pseudomonadota bacterium]
MKLLRWTSIIALLAIPVHTTAQQSPSPNNSKDKNSKEEGAHRDQDIEALKQEIEQLEAKDAEYKKKIEELKIRDSEQDLEHKKKIEEFKAEQEEIAFQASMMEAEMELEDDLIQRFRIFGFFDLSFGKLYYDEDSAYSLAVMQSNWTFFMSNFNLYVQSYMTQTLSVLGELRFTFLPHGQDKEFEYEGIPSEGLPSQGIYGNEYVRVNTRVIDPGSSYAYYPGGMQIERIHLTYTPLDWFNIIAGRFLTPFGIWNVDHGSPVVLPIRLPWLIIRKMLPIWQLGFYVYGRVFPSDRWSLDYGLTLSNGRGAAESVQDLDDHKAVGLRLRLSYQGDNVKITGGAYGYYGTDADNKKTVHIVGMSDLASDEKPLQVEITNTIEGKEYSVSFDFLLEAFGFRLQSEYVWHYLQSTKSAPISSSMALFHGASPFQTILAPNLLGNDVYVLLAYELPLEKWLGAIRIIPYFMYEYGIPYDMYKYRNNIQYIGGFNIKPSPFVTIKLEGQYLDFNDDAYGGNGKGAIVQTAVSF